MFVVTVTFHIKPGLVDTFLPLMRTNATASLSTEPGCLVFDVCSDPDRPDEIFLYEIYESAAAFRDHLTAPHFLSFDAQVSPMIATKTVTTYSEVAR